ncbi:MAG: LexA family transcriptional regulator [Bacteroidales bacterium]|nr:LexA family transcriptional regulator [Bacteroidales bacterium]MDD3010289.1 LexA family transcriptional regulator [Bacteroidales bacterium]MDD3960856.1 LexA family transcriptional regulator [Bacteroidales bacterium]MDY0284662.1 LexA family transcriptional regulator [Bacteroidales bacterium]HPE86994.1 LexA family transcriptional regulator [Bacteroidales bacterium]
MKTTFCQNIKFLRTRRGRTQDDVASALNMKRSTLSGYENGVAQPNMEALVAFSEYYKVAIDSLIRADLSHLSGFELSQLERGYDVFVRGTNLRILATTVNSQNIENIELVNERAKAGYTTGYADPEYIKVLPTFHLPFLSKERKYRTFQISGDSMLPIPDGAYITGEFVQNWETIRNKWPYIVLTLNDGIVFKIAENRIKNEYKLTLHSLNTLYDPFDIHVSEIREVWKFVNYISPEIPEPNREINKLTDEVTRLKKTVQAIQLKMDL